MTIAEVAAAFKVNRATVSEWKKQGCPCINLKPESKRDMCRFSLPTLETWLREREQVSTTGKEAHHA